MEGAHERFLRRAIELARGNVLAGRGGPFGAVIVRDGQVVGEGTNLVTSSNDPTAHAEVVAIRSACSSLGTFDLRGTEIYASCEPCPMCLAATYWARIGAIHFGAARTDAAAIGFDDEFFYEQLAKPPEDRVVPARQLLRSEALAAFDDWRRSSDRIPY